MYLNVIKDIENTFKKLRCKLLNDNYKNFLRENQSVQIININGHFEYLNKYTVKAAKIERSKLYNVDYRKTVNRASAIEVKINNIRLNILNNKIEFSKKCDDLKHEIEVQGNKVVLDIEYMCPAYNSMNEPAGLLVLADLQPV